MDEDRAERMANAALGAAQDMAQNRMDPSDFHRVIKKAFFGLPNPTGTEMSEKVEESVHATVVGRSKTYGKYEDQATFAQSIKRLLQSTSGWRRLSEPQKESMEMIATKQARILFGEPNHVDSWHDIAGYATLVELILKGEGV